MRKGMISNLVPDSTRENSLHYVLAVKLRGFWKSRMRIGNSIFEVTQAIVGGTIIALAVVKEKMPYDCPGCWDIILIKKIYKRCDSFPAVTTIPA